MARTVAGPAAWGCFPFSGHSEQSTQEKEGQRLFITTCRQMP
ncbi:hypothetical protein X474_09050 [Dethiosulfatarculus sandiegensis]|uniref:Uncharacterized protein n=1 Tax=Dethiosulfatarculus sandiegensis TaxID=1429043 RepID=A0A0D2JXR6_9BACT|nr:hypothetical protein X474_09050 [Dethiosulfatarculus sandiegensis]